MNFPFHYTSKCIVSSLRKCHLKFNHATCIRPSPLIKLICSNNQTNHQLASDGATTGSMMLPIPLVHHLERTSLVDFDNTEALSRLTEAIGFANQLFEVNTDRIEPLVTVLENESLFLREDCTEPCNKSELLSNAKITEEDYYVAPPGNVPLEPSTIVH